MSDVFATLSAANPNATTAPGAVSGGTPSPPAQQAAFDPSKSYGTPSQLLDNLHAEEDSGSPYAVNPKTQAMGPYQFLPSTVAQLRKQGVVFDPFDEQQSRAAADYYLQQLKQQNGGTYEGALKAYGGFKNADPTQYIAKAMSGVQGASAQPQPTTPGQSYSGAQPSGYSGPTTDLFTTLQQGAQPPKSAPQAPSSPAAQAQPQTPSQPQPGPLAQFGQASAGLADTFLGAAGSAATAADYAVRRALGQNPAQAQTGSTSDFGASQHPIGNLFGVTNTPGYQGEASQRAGRAVGGAINSAATAVAGATGLPQSDVANMAGSLSMLVPGAIKAAAPIARDAALETAAEDTNVRPEPAAAPSVEPMTPRPMAGGGAASSNLNPYPVLTGEDASRGPFPQVKLSKVAQDVTPQEQAVRASIANEIMGDQAGTVRTGVVTGNENTLRNEYAAAKSPDQTPASQALRGQIAAEQQALADYAEQRVNATGASQTIGTNEERGRVINDALYGDENSLSSYLQNTKRAIYDQARATAGNNPIQTSHIDNLLTDPQFQAGVKLSGNEGTLGGAAELINLARTTGFRDPVTGDLYSPNSVGAWDAVRKAINSEWSPSNRNVVRQINGAIDQDIAATGGEQMYKLGDRIHQVQQTLLDSKGIGSVLGEYDANGIKTGTPLENIPAKLNSMPLDQWQHIHDTLDDLSRGQIRGAPDGMPPVPPEVQDAAAQALNEMHGALARSVYEAGAAKAGVWNQNAVNKVLNSSVGQKITRTFAPDEVQRFHALNYGGQIMPGVHAYEGAGNQLARMNNPGYVERFAPRAATSAGAAIGSTIPIPGAGWAGAALGERLGSKISNAAATRRAAQQLQAVTEEMRRNAELGSTAAPTALNSLLKNAQGKNK